MTTRIIIPAHNHKGMTDTCLNTVLSTIDAKTEVVLIDDASSPPLECSTTTDPRVREIRNKTCLGFAGSCNRGAEGATTEFLIFLNNDTTPHLGWHEAMLRCVISDPTVGIVGCRLLYSDATVQHAGVAFSQADGEPRHIYRGFPGNHPAVVQTRSLQVVTGACLLIRRTLFEALGGFDTTFTNGFEDIDLCLRADQAGHKVVYCGEAVVSHLESISRRPADTAPSAEETHNRSKFAERWATTVRRDELSLYVEDGLITLAAGDVYPLHYSIATELATTVDEQTTAKLARLLNIRSRQVFDLQREIGFLTARLRDHGIEA